MQVHPEDANQLGKTEGNETEKEKSGNTTNENVLDVSQLPELSPCERIQVEDI